jgi:DNA-3-methyladenine glycosylase
MVLGKEFFSRSSVVVARDLLGKYLVRKIGNRVEKFKIVETEAYEGFDDKASHASRGKTPRNTPMFEGPATIYVYFTYGMHYMLNIVCGPKNYPSAVLIRGISPPFPLLHLRGGIKTNLSGPGRLTKYLQIDKSLNNKKLGKSSGLWVEFSNLKIENSKLKILKTPRVGIDYSGPIWSKKLWRFVLKEN